MAEMEYKLLQNVLFTAMLRVEDMTVKSVAFLVTE